MRLALLCQSPREGIVDRNPCSSARSGRLGIAPGRDPTGLLTKERHENRRSSNLLVEHEGSHLADLTSVTTA